MAIFLFFSKSYNNKSFEVTWGRFCVPSGTSFPREIFVISTAGHTKITITFSRVIKKRIISWSVTFPTDPVKTNNLEKVHRISRAAKKTEKDKAFKLQRG